MNIEIDKIGLSLSNIYTGYKCLPNHVKKLKEISTELNVPMLQCRLSNTQFAVFEE